MVLEIYKGLEAYQEVITRGDYIDLRFPIKTRFVGKFYRFENQSALKDSLAKASFFEWDSGQEDQLVFYHQFNRELKEDAFSLEINKDGQIIIETANMRAFTYAQEALEKIMDIKDNHLRLPLVSIKHCPSFKIRGIIEGFYGEPWTEEERLDCLEFIGQNRMNTYMYAPKNDHYQRKDWRLPYPEKWLDHFRTLLKKAQEYQLDFWYMISPGMDFDYTNPEDYRLLKAKLQQMLNLGISHFGLLLDDIDYSLVASVEKRFKKTSFAQAHLIRTVHDYLLENHFAPEIVICPTEYDNIYDSLYLKELSEATPKTIPFFWTGPSTLASQISEEDLKLMSSIYQRPIIIWDNIPVNDYQKDYQQLFLAPYVNRSPFLAKEDYDLLGIVSNPMINWELSKLSLMDMSHYLWNAFAYQPARSFTAVLEEYAASPSIAKALEVFTWHNGNRHLHRDFPYEVEEALKRKDCKQLDQFLSELEEACQSLKEMPNESFKAKVEPWLNRIEKDLDFWELLKTQADNLADHYKQLQEIPYKTASDIPSRYYQLYHLHEEPIDHKTSISQATEADYL
ncbi:protein O-GlcNAcase [Streptococcus catagoni]|uniref:protein O-GlcNAcase n=1 Tax=Streptococcus catagoni TaxID=2654874 RepID=UPI00140E13FF|nr:protein O-GlcNAcase [Streptococcus catagoni]